MSVLLHAKARARIEDAWTSERCPRGGFHAATIAQATRPITTQAPSIHGSALRRNPRSSLGRSSWSRAAVLNTMAMRSAGKRRARVSRRRPARRRHHRPRRPFGLELDDHARTLAYAVQVAGPEPIRRRPLLGGQ